MSAAMLRVKSEIAAADDDAYGDVPMETVDERKQETSGFLQKLAAAYKEQMESIDSASGKRIVLACFGQIWVGN